jgi:uncharacterized protein
MAHFLCKLTPPRPSFLADMNEEETLIMRRHREYWMPRVEIGVVIAMGSVADPSGAYGVAIIEANSCMALDAMLMSDPALLSHRGFAYEVFSMPTLAARPSLPLAPVHSVSP